MADNVAITPGTGATVAADDIGGVLYQRVKLSLGADGSATDALVGRQAAASSAAVVLSTEDLAALLGQGTTITTTVTRPADTTAYAANDAWSDSTSAPTSGGFTLTGMGRASGGSGVITDILFASSADPATLLQGELWIFDSSVTAINDNAAFALSDGDVVKLVAVVPFTLATTVAGSGTNSFYHAQGLGIGFTCSGSADLRFLVKVKNAYTPISAEALTIRAKIVRTN